MPDSIPNPNSPAPVPLTSVQHNFFAAPSKLMLAVSDPVRWVVLRHLASGEPRTVLQLACKACRTPNQMSKHLRVLREAGALVLVKSPDGDKRKAHHVVPEKYRRRDETGKAVIDYGICVLRFP
jgi:DNA-binding transcriptional ArsR family regulator